MVVNVCDPGWVVQVGVEKLQMLSQAVPGGHTSTQTVVTILNGPTGCFTVNSYEKA